jgi:hypothetical protein
MLKLTSTETSYPAVALMPTPPASHRTNHGGNAWSLPDSAANAQPQDGVTHDLAVQRRYVTTMSTPKTKGVGGFSSVVTDPEDARLTGGTRSLMRRLLGLNLRRTRTGIPAKLVPVKAA